MITAISETYPDTAVNSEKCFFGEAFHIIRHFLPFGRADLTASAALRPIRSGLPRHHERPKGTW